MPQNHRRPPASAADERLFRGLSVYQDVVVAGKTVRTGQHACAARWRLIEPHLPAAGAFLDVGSNFGWFGLQIVQSRPDSVVASVEADPRSAAVQHLVLRSNDVRRICLLTQRAGAPLARRFLAAAQPFAGVLCLSVLHWMPDHREFLEILGPLSERLFIELPDAQETGAGVDSIRRAIGAADEYLAGLFPDRPRTCLGRLPSHRNPHFQREIWLVGPAKTCVAAPVAALDAAALLSLSPGWPPRSWWLGQFDLLSPTANPSSGAVDFTAHGLQASAAGVPAEQLAQLRRAARRVPERRAMPISQAWYRRLRRRVGDLLRAVFRHGTV